LYGEAVLSTLMVQTRLILESDLVLIPSFNNQDMHEAVDYLTSKDEVLNKIIQQYGLPAIPSRPQGFETLCKLILEQQVSIESGRACYQKVEKFLHQVTPKTISNATLEELRSCSVSRQKSVYLQALAQAVLHKTLVLETLSAKQPEEVRAELIQIKGIGNWTIDVYLMFALQSPDIIPLGDVAVVNTIKELYDCEDKETMILLSKNWKPYRSMATYFLWHHYLSKRNKI
jgi:DNA-3-methyladenine glycosylase II